MKGSMARLISAAIALLVFLLVQPPALDSLDARFAYAPHDALQLIALLGPIGRRQYLVHELADLAFIATYAAISVRLLGGPRRIGTTTLFLALLPAAADLIETSSILVALAAYPAQPAWAYLLMSRATPLKWLSGGALAALIGFTLARGLLRPRAR